MPAWVPAMRAAIKWGPVALEVTRQLDRQLRPHVRAYLLAESIDGYLGRWVADKGTHWIVFPSPEADPLRAFPPLDDTELATAAREFDRSALRHHSHVPEGRAREAARGAATRVGNVPGRVAGRLRKG